MSDHNSSGVKVSEAFYRDWEPFPYRFVNLDDLFLVIYSPPESVNTLEKSCDLIDLE